MKRFLYHLIHCLFPPICLHCAEPEATGLFCKSCAVLLQPLAPHQRCKHCFQESEGNFCNICLKHPSSAAITACVFENEGPAQILAKEIEITGSPSLIKAAASYLAYQFIKLSWEEPQITFIPLTIPEKTQKSCNSSLELAKETALLLKSPVKTLLKTVQTALFTSSTICHNNEEVIDQTILLVALESTNKTRDALEVLLKNGPKKVYFLTLLEKDFDRISRN